MRRSVPVFAPPDLQGADGARPSDEILTFKVAPLHRNVPDEELLADLRRVAGEQKTRRLSAIVYDDVGQFSSPTFKRRFGSWAAALLAVNLLPARRPMPTRDELIADIQRVASELEVKKLGWSAYRRRSGYAVNMVYCHFKYWEQAVAAAGLLPGRYRAANESDLFRNLADVWRTLKRQPGKKDIRQPLSKYSITVYIKRFGTYRKALLAFERAMGVSEGEKNPEEFSAKISIFRRKTPRTINFRLRYQILSRDNFRCCACGRSPATQPGVILQIDHKIPWSRGGETIPDNLQTLCDMCNGGKSNLV